MKENMGLVNFRLTKDQKRQLDYLANRSGKSVTQFLSLLIKAEIENLLVDDAYRAAVEISAVKAGVSPSLAKGIADSSDPNHLEDLKKILSEEFLTIFMEDFNKCWQAFANERFRDFGLEDTFETQSELYFYESNYITYNKCK